MLMASGFAAVNGAGLLAHILQRATAQQPEPTRDCQKTFTQAL